MTKSTKDTVRLASEEKTAILWRSPGVRAKGWGLRPIAAKHLQPIINDEGREACASAEITAQADAFITAWRDSKDPAQP